MLHHLSNFSSAVSWISIIVFVFSRWFSPRWPNHSYRQWMFGMAAIVLMLLAVTVQDVIDLVSGKPGWELGIDAVITALWVWNFHHAWKKRPPRKGSKVAKLVGNKTRAIFEAMARNMQPEGSKA